MYSITSLHFTSRRKDTVDYVYSGQSGVLQTSEPQEVILLVANLGFYCLQEVVLLFPDPVLLAGSNSSLPRPCTACRRWFLSSQTLYCLQEVILLVPDLVLLTGGNSSCPRPCTACRRQFFLSQTLYCLQEVVLLIPDHRRRKMIFRMGARLHQVLPVDGGGGGGGGSPLGRAIHLGTCSVNFLRSIMLCRGKIKSYSKCCIYMITKQPQTCIKQNFQGNFVSES